MSDDDKNNIWAKVLAPENWALKTLQISLPTTRFPELKILFPTLFANLVSRSNTTDQEAESVNKVFEGEPGKNYY